MLLGHCSVILHITFIPDENLGDSFGRMGLNLLHPVSDIIKGLFVSAVIDEDDAHSSFVIGLSDGSESLLASCVPNLQFNKLIINVDGFNLEIDS